VNHHIRRAVAPGLIAVLAVALGACGDDDAASAQRTTTSAAETTTTTTEPTTTTVAKATTTTEAPTTTAAAPVASGGLDTSDPDVAAVVTAFETVFDSEVPLADKEPYLPDAAVLGPVLEQYTSAVAAVGGANIDVTGVTIDGDTATAVFDVFVAGTIAQWAIRLLIMRHHHRRRSESHRIGSMEQRLH
jgi:hypothetical protein